MKQGTAMYGTTTMLIIRRIVRGFTISLLMVLAWGLLAGAFDQLPRSHTTGQQFETILQFVCGLLSLLCVLTAFWQRSWGKVIRIAWAISVVVVAGASSLVWGPRLPVIAAVFAGVAMVVALGVNWALNVTSDRPPIEIGANNAA